ncbi:MAG: sulfurtransferase [Pseudidiomarina maritima]|uniref:Sulfurtransferase n=1 Tax=Pseudidiomarina sp. PP-1MA TaxID=3237706 RepID=A0AB39X8Q9_9GAMM|nr:sulfurtransferase [Pseudidiomarina maritima]
MIASTTAWVDCDWLAGRLGDPQLHVLDASMTKVVGKEPIIYPQLQVIPGARDLALETELTDTDSALPNAMPTPEQVSARLQALGIEAGDTIILYDNQGVYSSPRAWFILKAMGIHRVAILNGGLPQWLAAGYQYLTGYAPLPKRRGKVMAQLQPEWLVTAEQIKQRQGSAEWVLLDARSAARFAGTAAEPRAGSHGGHIPGAINLPFANLLNGYAYKTVAQLDEYFGEFADKHLMFTCGSGITACILLLAAWQYSAQAGLNRSLQLYDGSWAEWSQLPSSE